MPSEDWSRAEVEAVVDDYLAMLASELAGAPYNKAQHRRTLKVLLNGRSESAIEFKHQNISAALIDAGFARPIQGYKPLSNYQALLTDVLTERFARAQTLQDLALADADAPMVVPEVDDILSVLTTKPASTINTPVAAEPQTVARLPTNYVEREARNHSLGLAGERFILNYERARLLAARQEGLAGKIEHTSVVRGDYEGYDILSFDETGAERLIEVKTTKYASDTPFFVTRNELTVSEKRASQFHLYRLYAFKEGPRLFTLPGCIRDTCRLAAASYAAVSA